VDYFDPIEDTKQFGFFTKSSLTVVFAKAYAEFSRFHMKELGFQSLSEPEIHMEEEYYSLTYSVQTPFNEEDEPVGLFKVIVEARTVVSQKTFYIGIDTDIDEDSEHMPAFIAFARRMVSKKDNILDMFKDTLTIDDHSEEEEEDEDEENY